MVPFGEEQLQAISKIKEFISSSNPAFTLVGSAGTGKTSIMMEIVNYLGNIGKSFALCAPTHQAKMILEKLSGHEAYTIHKLLSLSPDLEILSLDLRDLKFYGRKQSDILIPHHGIVIVDEASMINDELYDLILKKCKEYNTRVLFVGDSKQLAPVNSDYISKVFTLTDHFELTKIYRQDEESGLTDYLVALRDKSIDKFENSFGLTGSLEVFSDTSKYLKEYLSLLRNELGKNTSNNKLLAYTNNRVNAYNKVIRDKLFGSDSYYKEEILRGCDNFKYNMSEFYNSIDYIVKSIREVDVIVPKFVKLPGHSIVLYDTIYKSEKSVEIIDLNQMSTTYTTSLARLIENTRVSAIEAKNRGSRSSGLLWKEYYAITNSFACKEALYIDNRMVKKQTFDNGYALTVHKSW